MSDKVNSTGLKALSHPLLQPGYRRPTFLSWVNKRIHCSLHRRKRYLRNLSYLFITAGLLHYKVPSNLVEKTNTAVRAPTTRWGACRPIEWCLSILFGIKCKKTRGRLCRFLSYLRRSCICEHLPLLTANLEI
jgi:hypothetical protein